MNRYAILDAAEQIPFEDVKPLLLAFVESCVLKIRRDRWSSLVLSPTKLEKKFNDLWNHLDLDTATRFDLPNLSQLDDEFCYYDMDKVGYRLSSSDAQSACDGFDGFLFSKDNKTVIFLTHEDMNYLFKIKKG